MSSSVAPCWAIVELLGHRRLAGYLEETALAEWGFLRVSIPTDDGFVLQAFPPGSVYAITPTTEETAQAAARSPEFRPQPLRDWELRAPEPTDDQVFTWLRGEDRLERALNHLRQSADWIPTNDRHNAAKLIDELRDVDMPF